MPGLISFPPLVKPSPLLENVNQNIWVTGGEEVFSHLRHVLLRQPLAFAARVVSDAEIVASWLATVALQGKDILDPDAYAISTQHLSIADLVIPPDLLIIRMGVKVARNSASAECLGEALNLRLHQNKPTWLWDSADEPLLAGHMFWSDVVGRILRRWTRIQKGELENPGVRVVGPPNLKAAGTQVRVPEKPRKTLRGGAS